MAKYVNLIVQNLLCFTLTYAVEPGPKSTHALPRLNRISLFNGRLWCAFPAEVINRPVRPPVRLLISSTLSGTALRCVF